jgi:predicted RNase H-like HicB family nuclease
MEITEMEGFDYPVTLDRAAEGGLVVSFPNVPEAITQMGRTYNNFILK